MPVSTTYTLTVGRRKGAAARGQWLMQLEKLEEAVRAAADRAHLDPNIPATLITTEADPRARRIRMSAFVRHAPGEEPGIHFQDETGNLFVVPDKESLPYGKALRITFRIVLCPVSDNEEDGMFATGRIVNIGLV
ncbi:hypothetical protein NM688_g7063 [Phlebia brevispora]|uniref:Uncharacterized protein n=1 Tax=Phlebia brevispora TaxID=194682 RepID=A0ACC1S9G6_9APHY|nr:hypothetical protein NM688_g7063 [Phlebia brevispora]